MLEGILGADLQENQNVFIMVYTPGNEPSAEAQPQARAGVEATFQKTAAFAAEQGIANEEIEAAIGEAMDHLRCRKD